MKKINKIFTTAITISAVCIFLSCNGDKKEAGEETTAPKDTSNSMQMTAAPAPVAEPAFTAFDVVEIKHTVKDYDKWRPVFDNDSTARNASGLEKIVVARNMDNPNKLYIALKANDVAKAKEFANAARLKEVMEKGGVNSKPDVSFLHVIRFNPDAKEPKWVVITHKVKDFDAWVKVFDAEGKAARADQGLFDAVMARGVDDPNTVMLVFDIKDMDKARKSIMSDEKKKLMESAGVEGVPTIEFYNSTE
ncbi:MAG: hypothetical protein JST81_14085 [Bacteroidetes bacterium]|nr:hypothetical protein [Bacteroidota bacterium]